MAAEIRILSYSSVVLYGDAPHSWGNQRFHLSDGDRSLTDDPEKLLKSLVLDFGPVLGMALIITNSFNTKVEQFKYEESIYPSPGEQRIEIGKPDMKTYMRYRLDPQDTVIQSVHGEVLAVITHVINK